MLATEAQPQGSSEDVLWDWSVTALDRAVDEQAGTEASGVVLLTGPYTKLLYLHDMEPPSAGTDHAPSPAPVGGPE